MLLKGKGSSVNKEEAIKYFKKSIDLGNVKALYRYGVLLIDQQCGIHSLKTAAEKGYPKALYYYAKLLEEGEKFQMNKELSSTYLLEAAKKGHVKSMLESSLKLIKVEGDRHTNEEGFQLLNKACDKGDLLSIFKKGEMIVNENNDNDDDFEKGVAYIRWAAINGFQ